MSRGILGTLQLVGTAVLVLPVLFFGLLKLLEGELLIAALFFCLGAVMFLAEEIYTSPKDLPAAAIERVAGRLAKEPDEEE